ncbi:Methionine--tRNA ligase [uncultured archaeon]|nr:Methionine--tRNA ligase [uncultured archaeon]
MITWDDFEKVEIKVGTIIEAEEFPQAKNPAYKLKIDFGNSLIKKSSAQITELYKKDDLVGRQVICVTNFAPKQIANFVSEVLVLGVVLPDKEVVLLQPERKVPEGYRIG